MKPIINVQLSRTLSVRASTPANIEIAASRLEEAIETLLERHSSLCALLVDTNGRLYNYIGLFLNSKGVSLPRDASLTLASGDVIEVVPAIAGG